MKKVCVLAVLSMLSIVFFTSCEEEVTTGNFVFTAQHYDDSEKIEGVEVAISETLKGLTDENEDFLAEGETGSDGTLTFSDLTPGDYYYAYTYEIGNMIYSATDGTFTITADNDYTQTMNFDIQVGGFELTILDSDGKSIPGIKVRLSHIKNELEDNGNYYSLTTNSDGIVEFKNFNEGTYYYYYYYEDGDYYWENTTSIEIDADDTYQLELTLN